MISGYPHEKEGSFANVNGVSTYTYHLAPYLQEHLKKIGKSLIIIADKSKNESNEFLTQGNGALIYRCWEKNSKNVYKQILLGISKFNRVNNIFIHFEFNLYGDGFMTGLFPLFLFSLRDKNTTLLLHQVAEDLTSLSGHLGIKSAVKLKFLDFIHHRFYWFLLNLSDKVIVHDQILKERLLKISQKPVFVVPHGLGEYKDNCLILKARDHLKIDSKDFVILCFGFLTWYKGSDWIIDRFAEFYRKTSDESIKLVMAGGESANLKDKTYYKSYYRSVLDKSKSSPNISITGFIEDKAVPYYFCSADLVILPYRTQMSASGPFAVALSFDRPFLLSENLKGVLETYDVKEKMEEIGLTYNDLVFSLEGDSFFKKIAELAQNPQKIEKMAKLASSLKVIRDWDPISARFLSIIDA